MPKPNFSLEEREHAIFTLNEYVKLIESVGGKDEALLRPLFLGYSAESIQADRVTFYFCDSDKNELHPNLTMVYEEGTLIPYDYYSDLKDAVIPFGEDICGQAATSLEGILSENPGSDPQYSGIVDNKISFKAGSLISIPLQVQDRCIGVMEIANSPQNRILNMTDFALISIFARVTLITMEKAKLYSWSVTDNLTQLYNYHYLSVNMEKELTRAKRYPKDVGIILIDIDNFKTINDTQGHETGNAVLRSIAHTMKETIRQNVDMPIRYGGDEFLLILPETDLSGTKTLAKRLKDIIQEEPISLEDGNEVKISLSMGITAAKKDHILNKDKLLLKADNALYKAKEEGKNRIVEIE